MSANLIESDKNHEQVIYNQGNTKDQHAQSAVQNQLQSEICILKIDFILIYYTEKKEKAG